MNGLVQQSVSEAAGEDLPASSATAGVVAVDDVATGTIGRSGDRDWFAVELEAGKTYRIDLKGRPTGDGTLSDPYLRGIHDAEGNLISGTTNDDGGHGVNSRLAFTASESGTHYIAAGAYSSRQGTYELAVTDVTPPGVVVARAPVFGQQSYAFDLAENADGSTSRVALGTVSATDPEGSAVSYSIAGGNAAGLFEIDASTGALYYTGSGEDYETDPTSRELTVRASDGGLHTDVTVTVSVTDAAEAPVFGQQGYAFDLAENADGSASRVALGTVSATDPEGSAVSYSIAGGNAAGLFEIDASTGALYYTGSGEDYETDPTSRELTVRASDGSLHTDTTVTVTVTVTDVQEAAPEREEAVVPPAPEPEQSVSEAAGEDLPASSATAGVVAVGDVATGAIGRSGDRDWFAVELEAGKSYRIDLKGRPTGDGTLSDPYLRGIHDAAGNLISGTTNDDGGHGVNSRVAFTASESGTHYIAAGAYSSRQGTYEVAVADVTPPGVVVAQAPVFGQQSYAFALAENADGSASRVALGTVSATDPEGSAVSYSIAGGNAAGLFEIDASTGALYYTGSGEDYETDPTSRELTVRASDGSLHTDTTVTVTVTDVQEAAPEREEAVVPPAPELGQSVSEAAGEDLPASSATAGVVAVDGTATGAIGRSGDRDWFAVELEAGKTYRIDLKGRPTGDGTLSDPYLRGIHDAEGNLISGTTNDDGGHGVNSRLAFTTSESGTHYIAAGAYSSRPGYLRGGGRLRYRWTGDGDGPGACAGARAGACAERFRGGRRGSAGRPHDRRSCRGRRHGDRRHLASGGPRLVRGGTGGGPDLHGRPEGEPDGRRHARRSQAARHSRCRGQPHCGDDERRRGRGLQQPADVHRIRERHPLHCRRCLR